MNTIGDKAVNIICDIARDCTYSDMPFDMESFRKQLNESGLTLLSPMDIFDLAKVTTVRQEVELKAAYVTNEDFINNTITVEGEVAVKLQNPDTETT